VGRKRGLEESRPSCKGIESKPLSDEEKIPNDRIKRQDHAERRWEKGKTTGEGGGKSTEPYTGVITKHYLIQGEGTYLVRRTTKKEVG